MISITTNKEVTCIILDWAGVFCSPAEPFALERFQKKVGLEPDPIAAEITTLHNDYYKGKITSEAFWKGVFEHFKLAEREFTAEEMIQAYKESYTFYDDVIELVQQLKKKYMVVLLSNLTPDMKEHILATHDIGPVFDKLFFSCDKNLQDMKPNQSIYQYVLEKCNRAAEECFFIDDSLRNVEAAQQCGLQAAHTRSRETTKEILRKLLGKNTEQSNVK
jgi:putative hydrolase of the HAD superfamily